MNLPNFAEYGYSIELRLNQNLQGGRITYKGVEMATDTPVIIKQFRFATQQDWSAYKQVEREINILQGLDHPGIPRYLKEFDPGDGICLVQEYKNAQDLSHFSSFSPEEIKDIAIQLLEILVYLQTRIPLIIHRDIKPENVLFEILSHSSLENPPQSPLQKQGRLLKVYLVDFGFARIGGEVTALSSMVAGTTGFMPPEQMLNKTLTESSDLYGLGATLICLLTGKKSIELGELVDHSFRIDYKSLVSRYSLRFIDWLDLMVEPDVKKRFKNAETALQALHPLGVIRVPVLRLDNIQLEFIAQKIGEKLTKTVTVINQASETVLEGQWSVSPHPSDPPHTPDEHSWIKISPQQFRGNQVQCNVTVDTSKLRANKDYEREIILRSNAEQENHHLKVQVRTAAPIVEVFEKPPYLWLAFLCVIGGVIFFPLGKLYVVFFWEAYHRGFGQFIGTIIGTIIGITVGAMAGIQIGVNPEIFQLGATIIGSTFISSGVAIFVSFFAFIAGATVNFIVSAIAGVIVFNQLDFSTILGMILISAILSSLPSIFLSPIIASIFRKFKDRGLNKRVAWLYILLSGGLGLSIGIAKVIGLSPYVILALVGTGLPLAGMLLYPPLRQRILKAQYYRYESQDLIEP